MNMYIKCGNRKYNVLNILLFALVVCFVLQDLLLTYIGVFSYLDEVVSVLLFLGYISRVISNNRINKREVMMLCLMLTVIIIGLLSNAMSAISRPIASIVMDIGNEFKFLLVYLGTLYWTPDISNRRLIRKISSFVKCYLLVLLVCAVLNILTDIGMFYEIRYGLRSFAFIYGIPGVVINHCTYILVILLADQSLNKKKNTLYIIANLLVILSTLRSRGFGIVALFCMLYYLIYVMKKKNIKTYILVIAVILAVIGSSQIETYFITNTSAPRAMFLNASIQLAREYFPFGAGLATFGSYAAAYFYSPLYYQLGFHLRYGMGPVDHMYLSDNYWPTILGEFGVSGCAVFIVLLYYFFRNMHDSLVHPKNKESLLAFWFVTLDILLSSIQSSYIAHYSMIALVFISMVCFNNKLYYTDKV